MTSDAQKFHFGSKFALRIQKPAPVTGPKFFAVFFRLLFSSVSFSNVKVLIDRIKMDKKRCRRRHFFVFYTTFIEETRTSVRRLPALFFRATTNDSTTTLCDSATTTSTICHFLCPRASFSLSKTRI